MCKMIRDDFGGVVPDTIEDLTKLPGVGRKTANLIVGDIYGKPAVVTDTHCIRIAGRLGLTANTAPEKGGNRPAGRPSPRGIQRLLSPAGASRAGCVHGQESPVRNLLHGSFLQEKGCGAQRGKAGPKEKTFQQKQIKRNGHGKVPCPFFLASPNPVAAPQASRAPRLAAAGHSTNRLRRRPR